MLQQFQKNTKRTRSDCLEAINVHRSPLWSLCCHFVVTMLSLRRHYIVTMVQKCTCWCSGPACIVEVVWATEIDCCLAKGSKASLQKLLLLWQSAHPHPWHCFFQCIPMHSNALILILSELPPKTTLRFTFHAVLQLKLRFFFSKEE